MASRRVLQVHLAVVGTGLDVWGMDKVSHE